MKNNEDKDRSIVHIDDKCAETHVAKNYNAEHDTNARKNKKMVYQKQHHDPNRTIEKPYKFGIPGGPIFEKKVRLRN